MGNKLNKEIQYIRGIGPKRAELLNKELGIFTLMDLLEHYPYKYIDRSRIYSIRQVKDMETFVQIKGHIIGFKKEGTKYKQRLKAVFSDDTGSIELTWFQGISWVLKNYQPGIEYIVFGKPALFNRTISIAHPEIETAAGFELSGNAGLQAQYNTTEKMKAGYINSKSLQKIIKGVFETEQPEFDEYLPAWLMERYRFVSLDNAYRLIHLPDSNDDIERARFRLKFNELLVIQLNLLRSKLSHDRHTSGFVFGSVGEHFNDFYHQYLPFELTGAQKRVIREIRHDTGRGKHMNRLLQGDVGSGKTLVALMSMLLAIDNGYQACLVAPTEILAQQHFATLKMMLGGMPIQVSLLTGSTRKKAREGIHASLQNGMLHILVGTHAILEDTVNFLNLGLAVIDEQHRFGVAQRAKLWTKNVQPPHILVMTATPIPRTLAMTLYGDLDVSVIDELPPGRKPIQTTHYFESRRLAMYGFLKREIALGRQAYVVFPLIQESEKLDYKALDDGYDDLKRHFPYPEYNIVRVHGRMKADEKELSMKLFKEQKAHIMVATTVIEVGVDVPNASVMVIESAERFGLSQLHQLRGRVGRGAEQSYCVLMSSVKLSTEGKKRLETMVATNNGFDIAEADLKLRGPGDLEGTQQSGLPFKLKVANIARDGRILQLARDAASQILETDPLLENPEHLVLKNYLDQQRQQMVNWSVIS